MESDISSNSEGEDKNDQERNSSADREDDIKPDTSTQTSRTEEESSTGWRKLPSSEEIEDEGDNRSEYRLNTTKAPKHPQVPISHPVHTAKTQCSTLVQRWGLFYAFWDNSWMPELLSCLVSVLALGGLLLVLGVYQGDVLQDLPIRLSINAIIAIFAAIIKASLIMPVAEG